MTHYLHHDDGTVKWIIGFDDATKKFIVYLQGDLDCFECEEIVVENSKKAFLETEGEITKNGKTGKFSIAKYV